MIVHYHAALLGNVPDDGLMRDLWEDTLLAVSEHRAPLVAIGWLKGRGRSHTHIVLFIGSRPLGKREKEPLGLQRVT